MGSMHYKITFYSDWHCGSGLSSGVGVNERVIRDQDGFPFISGRTMKGLLREAAETIGTCLRGREEWDEFIHTCFGRGTGKGESGRQDPPRASGTCFFRNAELHEDVMCYIKAKPAAKALLFRQITFTAVNPGGTAKDNSLRKAEVTVPLELFGVIDGCDKNCEEKMKMCMRFVKRIGANRNRGFGRCTISYEPGAPG
jgi:hypothetical protein